jgi:hypothetical protein
MKQSRSTSLLKAAVSTGGGFFIGLGAQMIFMPMLGMQARLDQNLAFAAIMTAVSIARGYGFERMFEAFGWRLKLSPFVIAVLHERQRQPDAEGFDAAHDDAHRHGELAEAGACYLMHAGTASPTVPREWPWDAPWWKPRGDRRRDLVRGVALGIAEGEKFDRARKSGRGRR